jgi:hypothetical protein
MSNHVWSSVGRNSAKFDLRHHTTTTTTTKQNVDPAVHSRAWHQDLQGGKTQNGLKCTFLKLENEKAMPEACSVNLLRHATDDAGTKSKNFGPYHLLKIVFWNFDRPKKGRKIDHWGSKTELQKIVSVVLSKVCFFSFSTVWSVASCHSKTPPRLGHLAPATKVARGHTLPF